MNQFAFTQTSEPVAFLFPGQGSQRVGMIQTLATVFPAARDAMAEADDILGFGLSRLCFEGPEAELTDTVNAQPALLAAGIAALRALQSAMGTLPRPRFVAGHSMGEYTALVAAGSLTYADGLRLVRERGRLMKQAGQESPGRMAAVLGLDEEKVAGLCAQAAERSGGIVQVANDNCPGQVVISGDEQGMALALEILAAAGAAKIVPLAVSIAAHSPLMAPAAEALGTAIESVTILDPQIPLIGNTGARPLTAAAEIRAELVNQLTGSVRWTASIRHALAAGVERFVEIGPGDVLTGLTRRIDRKATRLAVGDPDGVQAFVAAHNSPSVV